MTRQFHQQGWVSDAIRTKRGKAYKIRWRIRGAKGEWKQKSETLYGLSGKKAAGEVLRIRVAESAPARPNTRVTLGEFVTKFWRPHLKNEGFDDSRILVTCNVESGTNSDPWLS